MMNLNTMWMMMSMDVQVLVMAYMYNVYNDIIDVQKQIKHHRRSGEGDGDVNNEAASHISIYKMS